MDTLDIIDPDFSLSNQIDNLENLNGLGNLFGDNTYIYIGLLILLFIIGVTTYKLYYHRNKHVTFENNVEDNVSPSV